MTGRARDNRLVHLPRVAGVRPGDVLETVITGAAPHHLRADGPLLSHRRTAAGDAAEAGRTPTTPGVLLGMPRVGAPAGL
jgi:tRNA-2-methylthio-N6-dimethylallyladenosine synthase